MKTYNIVCEPSERFDVMQLIREAGGSVTSSSGYYDKSIIHFVCTEAQAEAIARNL